MRSLISTLVTLQMFYASWQEARIWKDCQPLASAVANIFM